MNLREALIIAQVHSIVQWPLMLATAIFYAFALRAAYYFGAGGSVYLVSLLVTLAFLCCPFYLLLKGERATRQVYDAWVAQGCTDTLVMED